MIEKSILNKCYQPVSLYMSTRWESLFWYFLPQHNWRTRTVRARFISRISAELGVRGAMQKRRSSCIVTRLRVSSRCFQCHARIQNDTREQAATRGRPLFLHPSSVSKSLSHHWKALFQQKTTITTSNESVVIAKLYEAYINAANTEGN